MRIAQITDLHIDREGELPFGINVRQNLLNVLTAIRQDQPDHLVISGDLCYREGDAKIYAWVKSQLDESGIPYDIIPGNHDSSSLLANVFNREQLLTGEEFYYARKFGPCLYVFLDSAKGAHSARQLKWLKRQLGKVQGELTIFMHHPPAVAGVPFMDGKYPLRDIEVFQSLLFSYPLNINIFCGHFHVEKTIRLHNLLIFITPSCFFQIDQNSFDFKVDHHRIAYRLIENGNQYLRTTVKYLPGAKT